VKRLTQKVCEKRVQGLGFRVRWVQNCWVGANKRERQTDQRNEQVKSQFDKLKKFFLKTQLLQPKTKHMRKISLLAQFLLARLNADGYNTSS
jgi:hypothetical protein